MPFENILSVSFTVGHVQMVHDNPALTSQVALETLNRNEIVQCIRTVDGSFAPDDQFVKDMQLSSERAPSGVTLDGVTLGSLLWRADSHHEATLHKIFQHNFEQARDQIQNIALSDFGTFTDLPGDGAPRTIVLVQPTPTIKILLSLAGIWPAQEERLKRLYPEEDIFKGSVTYAENIEGMLVAQWENAKRIRRVLNWALKSENTKRKKRVFKWGRKSDEPPELDFVSSELIDRGSPISAHCFSLLKKCYTPLWSYRDITDGFRETFLYSAHAKSSIFPRHSEEAKVLVGALMLAS